MKTAFIGHTYHQKTRSSLFFIEEISEWSTIDFFWDSKWNDGRSLDLGTILAPSYDLIVLWQVEYLAPLLASSGHPNVIFVPMYDACKDLPDSYWRGLRHVKIFAFCRAVYERAVKCGLVCEYHQYFPAASNVPEHKDRNASLSLRGYFWQRKQSPNWRDVRALIGETDFSEFTLHGAIDPAGAEFLVLPSADEIRRFNIRVTAWSEDPSDNLRIVAASDVYFAPRLFEGIGMSFLEAMGSGVAVVAPDTPTMNEYIVHGINGFLYDPDNPKPVDFSRARECGQRAHAHVVAGRERWIREKEVRRSFFVGDKMVAPRYSNSDSIRVVKVAPIVSVVTVVFNAAEVLEETIRSVLEQEGVNFEYIIVDGGSTDGTLPIVEKYRGRINHFVRERDHGPYDAMNKAARLASGHWIFFLNAGDRFLGRYSLKDALVGAPEEADFVIGHHLYKNALGVRVFQAAASFDETWRELISGELSDRWLSRIPGHQATFTRVALLRKKQYDLAYKIAADHEFMFRMKAAGASFHHSLSTVAEYVAGGLSSQSLMTCVEEWLRIALSHSPNAHAVRRFYRRRLDEAALTGVERRSLRQFARVAFKRPWLAPQLLKLVFIHYFLSSVSHSAWATLDFKRHDWGDRVIEVSGISDPEAWGAWTDGAHFNVGFSEILPERFEVALRVRHRFEPSLTQPIKFSAGDCTLHIDARSRVDVIRASMTPGRAARKFCIVIPACTSPKFTQLSSDSRLLGLGLISLTITKK
jgi:glycosyltransferase involved in cell wall biosynthesis